MSLKVGNIVKSKDLLGNVISVILSFFLSIFIFLTVVCGVIQTSVLSRGFFERQLSQSNYYDNILKKLSTELTSLGIVIGVDESFMTSLVTREHVKNELVGFVDIIFDGKESYYDIDGLKDQMYNKLANHFKERNRELTKEHEQSLHLLVDDFVDKTYLSKVSFVFPKQLNSVLNKIKQPIFIAIISVICLSIIACATLFFMHKDNKLKFLKYFIYSISSSFLYMFALTCLLLTFSKTVERLAIGDKALYFFVVTYFKSFCGYIVYGTILITCLTIGVCVWYRRMTLKLPNKENFDSEDQNELIEPSESSTDFDLVKQIEQFGEEDELIQQK